MTSSFQYNVSGANSQHDLICLRYSETCYVSLSEPHCRQIKKGLRSGALHPHHGRRILLSSAMSMNGEGRASVGTCWYNTVP